MENSQLAVTGTVSSVSYTRDDVAPGEIVSLRDEIDRYAATIDQLHDRLGAVLKPEYDEPNQTASHPMPILSEIATLRSALAVQTTRLNSLLDRIDL